MEFYTASEQQHGRITLCCACDRRMVDVCGRLTKTDIAPGAQRRHERNMRVPGRHTSAKYLAWPKSGGGMAYQYERHTLQHRCAAQVTLRKSVGKTQLEREIQLTCGAVQASVLQGRAVVGARLSRRPRQMALGLCVETSTWTAWREQNNCYNVCVYNRDGAHAPGKPVKSVRSGGWRSRPGFQSRRCLSVSQMAPAWTPGRAFLAGTRGCSTPGFGEPRWSFFKKSGCHFSLRICVRSKR